MRVIYTTALGSTLLALSFATVLAQTRPGTTPATPGTQPPTQAPAPTGRPDNNTMAAAKSGMAKADEEFVKESAMGGMAEVELGQLASEKAANARVKMFAQQMVTDHGKANDELKSLAASKNITLATTLDTKHKATKDRLAKLEGAAFDRAYVADMLSDHETDIAAFRRESQSGQDSEVKAFAAKTLPTLEGHLQMVQGIQKEMGTGTATGTSGRSSGTPPTGATDQPASGATPVPNPR